MASASFGIFSKRRNSTKQPVSLSDVRTVTLKEGCSQDRPTFILTGNNFNYNYCMWDSKYYFITDVVSLHNNLIEVNCVLDPLATYKAEILSSTQYVAYSSINTSIWLPDTRIPLLKNASVDKNVTTLNMLFTTGGFYVLCVVGKEGCETWMLDKLSMGALLDRISDWSDNLIDDILAGNYPWTDPASPQQAVTYDWTNSPQESFAKMNMLVGMVGNAYSDAPSCIRSCIWVPFMPSLFDDTAGNIFLGQFDTQVTTFRCKTEPASRTASVAIPWQHNDWRRAVCEEVYLYLPLVGMVSIPSDEVINETQIDITWSATATDGCIAYLVKAGNQIIGTYGANASVNYPIGISQQASAGEIVQTAFQGVKKTVSAALSGASSLNPMAIGAGLTMAGMEGLDAGHQTANVELSRHNSCIGGIGGGAGVGLDLDAVCFTVSHDTVVAPSAMQNTMGLPTMAPVQLTNCSGYCQCVNAHIDAPATAEELNAIDFFLNTGFFIE